MIANISWRDDSATMTGPTCGGALEAGGRRVYCGGQCPSCDEPVAATEVVAVVADRRRRR